MSEDLTDEELAEAMGEGLEGGDDIDPHAGPGHTGQYPKLIPTDKEEEIPPEPSGFIVTPDFYGKGVRPRVTLASGQPVGIWLDQPGRREMDGAAVTELLLHMGLDEENAVWFGLQRQKRLDGFQEVKDYPAIKGMIEAEAQREQDLIPIREAFVKSRRKREK